VPPCYHEPPASRTSRPAEVAIPDRISILADVAEIVSRSHDLEETLTNVTELVARRLEADVCSVYLTDTDLTHLTLRATKGLDPKAVGRVRLELGEGLVGLAAEQGEPIAMEHASADPRYRYFPESGEERFESLLAVPLTMQGSTIGVLVTQTETPRQFHEDDVDLLQTCAQLIAPVVVNAQLLSLMSRDDAARSAIVERIAEGAQLPRGMGRRTPRDESNVELRGIPTSRGVAIGPVYRVESPVDLDHIEYAPADTPEKEALDLKAALAATRREIEEARENVGQRFGPEFAAVFHTQIQILEDKGFVQNLEQAIAREGHALKALRSVLDAYRETFERIEDPYFRDRGADIQDVGQRVIEQLLGVRDQHEPMQPGSVVVVDVVMAGLFSKLEMDHVAAIVAEHGGSTSHGAIFARTLEIPAVTGVIGIGDEARDGEVCIVDGSTGAVYLSPDDALRAYYQDAQHQYEIAVEHLDALRERPAETRDGHVVRLSANVGLLADLRLVSQHGAEGIGLFRTELLALAHRGFPSQEEQEQLYSRVVEQMGSASVTIRTLDLGGDKGIPNIGLDFEENPQLGCRSIRLALDNERAFKAQLRAILRASGQAEGQVRLLLPMISNIDELREAKAHLEEARQQLEDRGIAYDPHMPVGIMIEVPSAALLAPALAAECDFFSIGTNDLTQYTLAVDRGNERVAHLYDSLHPAVLQLIDQSVRAAQRAGIPISICGEMASNPLAVPILVGLGIGELSGVPAAVPLVKEIVRALDSLEVAQDARHALQTTSAAEVHTIAAARLQKSGLLHHPDVGDWLKQTVESVLAGA